MKTARIALSLLAACIASTAAAADVPKRKSGLWEIRTQMSGMPAGMPGQGPMQMCIDQNSDNMTNDASGPGGKPDCPVMQIKPGAGKMTIHMVCRDGGTTATTDAEITGDFNRSYRSDMVTRFNPPRDGMKEMKMVQEARWLGPCQPGQKAGDMIMPGMGKYNMQEMMKNPQMRELMKGQQAPR